MIAKIEGVGISTVMRLKKEFCELTQQSPGLPCYIGGSGGFCFLIYTIFWTLPKVN